MSEYSELIPEEIPISEVIEYIEYILKYEILISIFRRVGIELIDASIKKFDANSDRKAYHNLCYATYFDRLY